MTTRKKTPVRTLTTEGFLAETGPGEPMEVLMRHHKEDVKWAERAIKGKEPLGPPIRIQRGRPRHGEETAETVVKAVRLPVHLLESLQAQAKEEGLSLNALLQMAAAEYLHHHRGA